MPKKAGARCCPTGLPSIGQVPGRPNCWAVLGYRGNGITFSRIAADVIRSALTGRADPDAPLFGFSPPFQRRGTG